MFHIPHYKGVGWMAIFGLGLIMLTEVTMRAVSRNSNIIAPRTWWQRQFPTARQPFPGSDFAVPRLSYIRSLYNGSAGGIVSTFHGRKTKKATAPRFPTSVSFASVDNARGNAEALR